MLKEIHFQNFRVLGNATLPLSRVTVLAGPNGSGKSTVLHALRIFGGEQFSYRDVVAVDQLPTNSPVEVAFVFARPGGKNTIRVRWEKKEASRGSDHGVTAEMNEFASQVRVFSLTPSKLAGPVQVASGLQLGPTGSGLAGVLDNMNDESHERFEALNAELRRWLPEFDRICFEVPRPGMKSFRLRRSADGLSIRASDLSEGTLFALALLTLSHLPVPPSLVALEHPDAGIHPRLLRKVQDAIYRLAFPEEHGEKRLPTQVIVTTHSPYFLDLFREHPEEIVFANKIENAVVFQRLSDRPHVADILPDGPLGELWYSGVLGGVPSQP